MPLLKRRRVLAFKAEVTPGTAVALAAADAKANIYDHKLDPTVDFAQREGQAGLSQLTGTQGAQAGRATFRTQLIGGATIPDLLAVLLPACGYVEATAVFGPVSQPPGAGGVTTCTLGLYIDGVLKKLHGCAGTAKFEFEAGKPVSVLWDFMGCWNAPTDVAILAPDYPTESPLRFAASALQLAGAYTPRVGKMTLDLGNEIVMRQDATTSTGYAHAMIVGRRPTITMDPESALVAARDWYGIWLANTENSCAWSLGSVGNRVAFSAPKAQISQIAEGDRDNIGAEAITLQLNRSADAGDDELTITVD